MWELYSPASSGPDLVLEAATRSLASSPAIYLAISFVAGVVAVILAARNAWLLRAKSRAHSRDLHAIRTRERRLRLAMRESDDGLVHLEAIRQSDGRLVDFVVTESNARAATLFRRSVQKMERTLASSLTTLTPDAELFQALAAALEAQSVYRAELRVNPRVMATSWLLVRAVPVDSGLAVSLTDIRDRKREAARLRRASMTDELTGLLNRRGFLAHAERELRTARHAGQTAVIFYADCDRFKQLNDTHGHAAGDLALREVARALRGAVRDTDLVARLGGDEFTLLALDASEACVPDIRSRIADRLDTLNNSDRLAAPVGLSIGHVVVSDTNERPFRDLLVQADRELYLNKRSRRAARVAMDSITRSSTAPLARPVVARSIATTFAAADVAAATVPPDRQLTEAASGS